MALDGVVMIRLILLVYVALTVIGLIIWFGAKVFGII